MSIEVEGFFFFYSVVCLQKLQTFFCMFVLFWDGMRDYSFFFLFLCWNMCTLVSITG